MTTTLPPLTEKQFQRQVTELAELLGWEWVHFRPAQTERGWRTPVSGTLGKGWVDLILVRERDQRIMFVELKAEGGKLTPEQVRVQGVLSNLDSTWWDTAIAAGQARIDVFTWWPSDWAVIEYHLR